MDNPSRKDSWKIFDRISKTYDRTNRVLSLGMDLSWRKKLASHLPKEEDLKILDLATGTGDQAIAFLNSEAPIHSITGIDLSKEMLEIAREKVLDAEFIEADAQKIPFSKEVFHAVSFSFGIRNVPSPTTALEEIHRVLKPRGRCLILEFSLPRRPIRAFYLLYLRHILPWLGGIISKNKEAYRYLNQTIEHFPSGKDFCLLMEGAGFKEVRAIPMNLGTVTLYIGEKH